MYALINALRLLCPRLDEDACEPAFCALIRARARQAASPLAVISGGLSRRELLRAARTVAAVRGQEFGITLSVSRLKVSEPSLRGIWRGLCRALNGKSVAIVGLDGAERHWTVGYAITAAPTCATSSGPPRCCLSGGRKASGHGRARDSESYNDRDGAAWRISGWRSARGLQARE